MDNNIKQIISHYTQAFKDKEYKEENTDSDILMELFKITPEKKMEHKQYWGRELGMAWQRLVIAICSAKCTNFKDAPSYGDDSPCDLLIGNDAIDTKYRIGSGDSGTLKKFKKNGELLKNDGFTPILLILREDNLPAAMTACKNSWTIHSGQSAFTYLNKVTNSNVEEIIRSYIIE